MKVATVDYADQSASKLFSNSLKESGFCVLKNHPLSTDLIADIYQEWREFFQSEAPSKYLFSNKYQDGYFPKQISEIAKGQSVKDLKHYYHLYFPWGRYPKEVSDQARQYFEQAFMLGKTLLGWIEKHMDPAIAYHLPMPLVNSLSYRKTLLRIMQYPPLTGNEQPGALRAASHEDINLITLLPVASEPGLEVYSLKENAWSAVKCHRGELIINIGDMLQEMTRGEYISTSHRVVNPTGEAAKKDRISMPTFVHAKPEVYLSERYPTAESYLNERLRELGVK